MFFDRNVYGIAETESFKFPDEYYEIKQMTFTEKSKISLLCLPDFFGYIFRKSKISQNRAAFGDNTLETSVLTINAYKNFLKRKICQKNNGLLLYCNYNNHIVFIF